MFVETITAPRDDWERWTDRLRLLSDPPPALVAVVAWDAGDGNVTAVHLWETPRAIADFFLDRVQPIIETEGIPESKPGTRGEPLAVYLRP